jgi:hypothetical protein
MRANGLLRVTCPRSNRTRLDSAPIMSRVKGATGSRVQATIAIPPDNRRCTGLGKDGERCRAWVSDRVLQERGEPLCAGHARLGVLKQDHPVPVAMPRQGTSAVPARGDGGLDCAASSCYGGSS